MHSSSNTGVDWLFGQASAAWNLVHSALVASAFEVGLEESSHDVQRLGHGDEVRRQAEYIGVVVLAGELRKALLPAERSTDTLVLVRCHADTVARRADNDTELIRTFLHSLCQGVGIVGVVATLVGEAAEIVYFGAVVFKEEAHLVLEREAGMVAGKGDGQFAEGFHGCMGFTRGLLQR